MTTGTERTALTQYASVRSTDESSSSSDEEEPPRDTDRSSCADVAGHPPRSCLAQSAYLACCCGINSGVYFLYHAVPSTATLLRRDFDFSATQIGTLQSMYSLPTLFVVFCSGMLVDRIGQWSSCLIFASAVLISSIMWCTALQFLPVSGSVLTLGICAQGLLGIGGESLFVAQKALLGASFGAQERGVRCAEPAGCQVKTPTPTTTPLLSISLNLDLGARSRLVWRLASAKPQQSLRRQLRCGSCPQ